MPSNVLGPSIREIGLGPCPQGPYSMVVGRGTGQMVPIHGEYSVRHRGSIEEVSPPTAIGGQRLEDNWPGTSALQKLREDTEHGLLGDL